MNLVVALTGGIGSGKSTVAKYFAARGVGVIDADQISHELTTFGSPIVDQIATVFGEQVLFADGSLNRQLLRAQIFQDLVARTKLEEILHPVIRTRMLEQLQQLATPYALLVIPLLFETGQESLADRVLVVDLPVELQIQRVQARNKFTVEAIRKIIACQLERQERLARAHDWIDNRWDLTALEQQVQVLHTKYLALIRDNN